MAAKLIRISFILALTVMVLNVADLAAQTVQDPASHPKFVNDLPIPTRIDATGGRWGGGHGNWVPWRLRFNVKMKEVTQWLGLVDINGDPVTTTVWGYGTHRTGVTYPGPTFVAMKDVAIKVRWWNKLPPYNRNFPALGGHLLPVDPSLHMAHPVNGGIPTVAHLHGGHTESASDGLPEAWFTQWWMERGPTFVKANYRYDNDQEAATLWYHDHALGITRLNVYAGLAGFYLLRDANEINLTRHKVLPCSDNEIEIVVQDRMFQANGELFFPSQLEAEPGFDPFPPASPSAVAEFFGDYILVNGSAWPKLDVEPQKYRFRFLNGSDSRFYVYEIHDEAGMPVPFMQIGTDNGFLPYPVELTQLLSAPGERNDLVVDFSGLAPGTKLTVVNLGPDEPFKGFNPDGTVSDGEGGVAPPADPMTTGQIMQFQVVAPDPMRHKGGWCGGGDDGCGEASIDLNTRLRPDIDPLVQDGATRNLVLFEGLDNYGRLQPLLGTLSQGSQAWFEPITENPMLNDTEIWEVYNATEDAHPIHLHLVSFQIMNRESFTGVVEEKDQLQHNGASGIGGLLTNVALGGDARGPEPNEMGWKDTAVMLPGEVTRVVAKFDREGRYVWHCHILSHEDHEMMRPYHVGPLPPAAVAPPALVLNDAKDHTPTSYALKQNYPNPFTTGAEIGFELPVEGVVRINVYNAAGQLVRSLTDSPFPAGAHSVSWNGRNAAGKRLPSGVYFYKLQSGSFTQTKKMVMVR